MATTRDPLLLQKSDFDGYRDISKAINDNRIDPYIWEAQRSDMAKLLGLQLYTAMINDYTPNIPVDEGTFTEQRFTDLFFGVEYTPNGFSFVVKFAGLKPALIYWAYRRIEHNQDINVTRFGTRRLADTDFSEHTNTYSNQVDAGSQALSYQSDVIDFLNDNRSLYPEWQNEGNRKRVGFNFLKV